jgi:hypothetical protein
MASIYETRGPSVQLTGPSVNTGFNPGQAYDPSQRMLDQSQKNLESFAGFSKTLNEFIQQKGKDYIKGEYDKGVADVINGTIQPNPEALQKYQAKVKVLENAALADEAVAKQMEQTDVGAAETYRQQSPAATGWRAYGQAVTITQQAAGQIDATLGAFLKDTETKISLTQPDGSVRVITPSLAKTQPELMAVWETGLRKFMDETGIRGINPAILSEHLTPVMVRTKGKLLGDRMNEIALNNKKERLDLLGAETGNKLPGFKDPQQAQILATSTFKRAYELTGNWKEANELGNQIILKKIEALGYSDPELAKTILDNYENSLIDPEQPQLLGVRDRFGEDIGALRSKLNGTIKEQAREAEESAKEEIEGLVNAYKSNPSPGLYADVVKELESRQLLYPEATAALETVRELGKNYNPKNDEALMQAIEKNIIKSYADVLALKSINAISDKAAQDAKALLPDVDLEKTLPPRNTMISFGRDYLRNQMKAMGISDAAFSDKTASTLNAVVDAASAATLRQLQSKDMDRFKAQTFMEEQIKAALGPNGDFAPRQDADKNWILPTPGSLRGLSPVRPRTDGPNGIDMANQALNKLPKIASARRDIMITRERLQLNLDVLQNGGQPSADFNVLVRASGLSRPQFIQKQLKFYPDLQYNPSADAGAQKYQDNLKYDRPAAEGLANPRIVGEQRDRLRLRIERAKQQQLTTFSPSGKSLGAGDYGGLAALISSGEGGFNSVNRGGAGDTPGGMNLTSMRIGDVQKLQAKFNATNGREGVFAVGFAQWISNGQLDMAVKAAGLGPNDKMTPENQLKMFWGYVLNTNKRPILRDYLLGKNNDVDAAQDELASEWAAVKDSSGRGRHEGGKGNNRASIDAQRARNALIAARNALSRSRLPQPS